MGNTEKKLLGGLGLVLMGLGTAGVGPLAFMGGAGGAAAGGLGSMGVADTGAASLLAGAGGTGVGASAGLGSVLGGLVQPAVGSAITGGVVNGAMKSMQPDVTTPLQMPPPPTQPDLMTLFKMFGNKGGL